MSELFRLIDINVRFHLAKVVRNLNLSICESEVVSIIGENAAGKSTVMKVLAGMITNYSGRILFRDKPVEIWSSKDARACGVHMLFHDPLLFDDFTVEYNIFAGSELCYPNTMFYKKGKQTERTRELLTFLDCKFRPDTLVCELSHAQKRMVEIAKALVSGANLLIFDEVTSQYTDSETQHLLEVIGRIKKQVAIVYISHNLEDVMQVSDKIIVMRDGLIIESMMNKDINTENLIDLMAGADVTHRYPRIKAKKAGKVLTIENLYNATSTVKDVSMCLRRGEIVGIAGFHDSGKVDLIKMLGGIVPIKGGRILVEGKPVKIKSPYQAIRNGIMYLSEENSNNIHLMMDASFNITIANLRKAERMFIINKRTIGNAVKYYIKRLNIKINDPRMESKYLSRGTQQKIALSKVLYADAQVLVMNEPTTSLDSPSKVEFYNIINQLAHKGKSILFSSSDLRELIGMCDRIYVVRKGVIVGELDTKDTSSSKILHFAAGKSASG